MIGSEGFKQTTIHEDENGKVFVTATGSIGMESLGRICVKSIEAWVALGFNDPIQKMRIDTTAKASIYERS